MCIINRMGGCSLSGMRHTDSVLLYMRCVYLTQDDLGGVSLCNMFTILPLCIDRRVMKSIMFVLWSFFLIACSVKNSIVESVRGRS